jgi:hypothetical protein
VPAAPSERPNFSLAPLKKKNETWSFEPACQLSLAFQFGRMVLSLVWLKRTSRMSFRPYENQNQTLSLSTGPPRSAPQSWIWSMCSALSLKLPSGSCRRASFFSSSGRFDDCRMSSWLKKLCTEPWKVFVPRLVTKFRPTPPVITFRSLPPVSTLISSKASKS